MQVTVDSRRPQEVSTDLLALPLPKLERRKWRLPPRAAAVDRALRGRISAVLGSGDFQGKLGQSLVLYSNGEIRAKRVLLVGLGDATALDAESLRSAAGTAVGQAALRRASRVALALPALERLAPGTAGQALAEGGVLAGYRFDRHQEAGEDSPGDVARLALSFERASQARPARRAARRGALLAECQNVARELSNQPANELPPAVLAREAQRIGREVGLRVRVFDVAQLRRRKMGGILAVGQGSAHPPRLIVIEHNAPRSGTRGSRRGEPRPPTVCLVGKGITFDSGGISIKPAAGMDEMKHDMSGAAAVVGALRACALLEVPLHVVGVVGAAENMPSGTAYRPGDVVRAMSGKSIEILNTDAEGRVVLADALHFARTEFSPRAMVDVATLTGACVVALGNWATGAFGNNERIVEIARRAGEETGERVWPMPLWDDHKKHIRSTVADVKNAAGREAGASTAAAFLSHFVGELPWVHLDIAGTGWTQKAGPYQSKGATGVGVRLLVEMLRDWKEKSLD